MLEHFGSHVGDSGNFCALCWSMLFRSLSLSLVVLVLALFKELLIYVSNEVCISKKAHTYERASHSHAKTGYS